MNQSPDLASLAKILALVVGRALLVLCVAIPVLLLLLLAGAFGSGSANAGLFLFVTVALAGLAWACLPLIHANRASGLAFGVCWFGLAVLHIVTAPGSLKGAAVASWFIATLFLAIKLKGRPPGYFPRSWQDASVRRPPDNGA